MKFSQNMVMVLKNSFRNFKNQSQKWEDWSFVHFNVRWNWFILLSADCCLSQQQMVSESIKSWF